MYSLRFKTLVHRIRELGKHLLPERDPTGTYTPQSYDCVRAFRLLSHAEIEAYIEDRCEDTLRLALDEWKKNKHLRTPLAYLLAYFPQGQMVSTPKSTSPPQLRKNTEDTFDGRIDLAWTGYMARLNANNGIKEENLLRMVLPVGIDADLLDSTWLSALNSYGRDRGVTAHSSITVQHPPDPSSEIEAVVQIIKGLKQLDVLFNRLLQP